MADSEAVPIGEVPQKGRGAGRHSGREVALQVLYAIDLGTRKALPSKDGLPLESETDPSIDFEQDDVIDAAVPTEKVFDRISENFDVPVSASEFARELVSAVVGRSADLDVLLGVHAKNWRVARMAAVDRNVLRIAAYELRDTETPVAVVIDEAVDLARRFGADTSPAFVNGILDAVAREVRFE